MSVTASGVASVNGQASVYTSHLGYDAQGDLTSASTPPITTTLNGTTTTAPVMTTYTDDGDGNQLTAVSANGATTMDAYDHLGRQITTTEPSVKLYNGTTTTPVKTTQYDGAGNAVRETDALGAVTTSSYDPLGREVSTTNPVSGTTLTTYNATEQVSAQDAQGNVTRESYDAAGRLIQATDALTGTVQYGYDAAGNTTAITTGDTSGGVTQIETRQYDALNRAITDTVTGPGGTPQTTTTRYDPDGNVYQINQPNGATTVDTYDLADQLVTSETDSAPVQSATHQQQTTYRYDAAGNTVETVDPDGRDAVTSYDGANRSIAEVSTTPRVTGTTTMTTTLGYDPDGNTLAQTVQTRDPSGNMQTFTDTASFDAADNQTSQTDNGVTTNYGYDAAGQQRTETIGNGASTVTRTLDPNGRETALAEGGLSTGFGYNANDQTTAITLPGGVSESARYDQNNRLTVWHDPGPGQNVTYAYGYDSASRVTSFTAVSGTDTLGYDPQNRLTSDCGPQVEAHSPDGCYRWTYDGGDNIHTATTDAGSPVTYTYTYNSQNELTLLHAPAYANVDTYYAYDQSGNTTNITAPVSGSLTAPGAINTSLFYNAAGRVTQLAARYHDAPISISIGYNPDGERNSYSAISGTQTLYSAQFSYSDGQLAQAVIVSATTGGGTTSYTDSYVYRADGTLDHFDRQQNGTTNRYWYETDGRGDIVAVTDANGNVVDSYEYDTWGEELTNTTHEQVPQRLRYAGLWWDAEPTLLWDDTGTSPRYYDPELDRYLQPDTPNGSYVFAKDDPLGIGGTAARSGGIQPRTSSGGCAILDPGSFPFPVCTFGPGDPIYMLLIGDDLNALGEPNYDPSHLLLKGVALVDLASNVTLVIPGAGEEARIGTKVLTEGAIRIASGTGEHAGETVFLRPIERGEKIHDLLRELGERTYLSGNEHAIVRLSDGSRMLVKTGQEGGTIPGVVRLIVHSHPYTAALRGEVAVSGIDRASLGKIGQVSSWLLVHGELVKFYHWK